MLKDSDAQANAGNAGTKTPLTRREVREAIPYDERQFLTEDESAAYIGVSKWTFRKWMKAGLITPVALPMGVRRNIYLKSEIDRLSAGR